MNKVKNYAVYFISIQLIFSFFFVFTSEKEESRLKEKSPKVYAFKAAHIQQSPDIAHTPGILIIRDGYVEAIGQNITIPNDALVYDLPDQAIYPGFIDLAAHSTHSHTDPTQHGSFNDLAQTQMKIDEKRNDFYRQTGFTSLVTHTNNNIFAGYNVYSNLKKSTPKKRSVVSKLYPTINFNRLEKKYPSSLMGVIAYIRQKFFDARWYDLYHHQSQHGRLLPSPDDLELQAIADFFKSNRKVFWKTVDEWDLFRAHKICQEFDIKPIFIGTGVEYRRAKDIKKLNCPLVIPIRFPDTIDVTNPDIAIQYSLQKLKHMAQAPRNALVIDQHNIPFSITAHGINKSVDFHENMGEVIDAGLPFDKALASLTTIPSQLIGQDKLRGTLEKGKIADFFVCENELFTPNTSINEVWIEGEREFLKENSKKTFLGCWNFKDQQQRQISLIIEKKPKKIEAFFQNNEDQKKFKIKKLSQDHRQISGQCEGKLFGKQGLIRFHGLSLDNKLHIKIYSSSELIGSHIATHHDHKKQEDKEKEKKHSIPQLEFHTPPGAYGFTDLPVDHEELIIRGATIWTCAKDAQVAVADLLIKKNKITAIGHGLKVSENAYEIDAIGKHITPGLIDCHSHTAISRGINEATRSNTSQVSIGDVINPDDEAIYQQLAGGLTCANLLHGSANTIGGQNAVVKFRWGALAEEMKIKSAIPGIKFALGENVKQSNWDIQKRTRYPQSRMGVEQFLRDAFNEAHAYQHEWQLFKNNKTKIPPKIDLRKEALVEILNKKRLVHCHSYRQDEILMLMRVAEDNHFTIGTFQHVLEGYKIAEVLKNHGAGASCFSDWWAYKFEVYDAIAYAGAIMHDVGVLVSFNSDSSELGRRMNLEAAKAVKYGGVPPEQALKFITLNPAKQLKIDHRVGSIEVGKDADFVIWSGNPLSTQSRCESTWIDGKCYFDINHDQKLRERNKQERQQLIDYLISLPEKKKENGTGSLVEPKREEYRCCPMFLRN